MPSGLHQLEVNIPIYRAWGFVSNINNWAPLVPGYVSHQQLNDKQSTWTFTGDAGIVQKTIQLKIDIVEWKEPARIAFTLKGINENFSGDGYFQADRINDKTINMTGHLHISAKGITGPMINPILKTIIPKTIKQFTETVADRMMKLETVAAN